MRLQILGSAAAEGLPAVFCDCETCRKARELGGKDHRFRTAYSLSETVRIDFGPDTIAQEYKFGLHSEKLRHLIMTHSHEDHLDQNLLSYRQRGYSYPNKDNLLTIYGNAGVLKKVRQACSGTDFSAYQLSLVRTNAFSPVEIPEEDMTLYPMIADHFPGEAANIFVIRKEDKYFLIGNDTGEFPAEDWEYLAQQKFVLDLVILDCTYGPFQDKGRLHMGGMVPVQMRDKLKALGCVNDKTQVYVNHFTHNAHALHSQIEEFYNSYGIKAGYDGCVIEF